MEKEAIKNNNNGNNHYNNHHHHRERHGLGIGITSTNGSVGLSNNNNNNRSNAGSSDFVLQWGNRKRLRCMKIQVKDVSTPVHNNSKTTVRVDRRVVRGSDKDKDKDKDKDSTTITKNNNNNNTNGGGGGGGGGYFNLRHRLTSPPLLPPVPQPQRVLRNSEAAMRGQQQSNGDHHHHHKDKKANNNNNKNSNGVIAAAAAAVGGGGGGGVSGASSDTAAHESNKKGGSSSGGSEAILLPSVWPPKFMIALTTKEKEEDFMAIKGSKLPQRPKKRAKFVQRTLNLVSPGAWLCDLTLDRYEVREKKVSKKRPRGLKAMGNMESDSE